MKKDDFPLSEIVPYLDESGTKSIEVILHDESL